MKPKATVERCNVLPLTFVCSHYICQLEKFATAAEKTKLTRRCEYILYFLVAKTSSVSAFFRAVIFWSHFQFCWWSSNLFVEAEIIRLNIAWHGQTDRLCNAAKTSSFTQEMWTRDNVQRNFQKLCRFSYIFIMLLPSIIGIIIQK